MDEHRSSQGTCPRGGVASLVRPRRFSRLALARNLPTPSRWGRRHHHWAACTLLRPHPHDVNCFEAALQSKPLPVLGHPIVGRFTSFKLGRRSREWLCQGASTVPNLEMRHGLSPLLRTNNSMVGSSWPTRYTTRLLVCRVEHRTMMLMEYSDTGMRLALRPISKRPLRNDVYPGFLQDIL